MGWGGRVRCPTLPTTDAIAGGAQSPPLGVGYRPSGTCRPPLRRRNLRARSAVSSVVSSPSTRTALGRADRPRRRDSRRLMGAARWGVLAACLAAAVAVLALVAGATGEPAAPCAGVAGGLRAGWRAGARRPLDRARRSRRARRGAGLARRRLRRAHRQGPLLAQRPARARRGRRALLRGLGRLVPHDGHRAARRRLATASSRSTTAPRGSTGA